MPTAFFFPSRCFVFLSRRVVCVIKPAEDAAPQIRRSFAGRPLVPAGRPPAIRRHVRV